MIRIGARKKRIKKKRINKMEHVDDEAARAISIFYSPGFDHSRNLLKIGSGMPRIIAMSGYQIRRT